MCLPAVGIAFQWFSVSDGLADSQDVAAAALAVVTHLSLARDVRTLLAWVAQRLATVRALLERRHAALAAAVRHQVLDALEALALRMTRTLADVPTPQREPARLTAVRSLGVAVPLGCLLPADASLRSWLEARWAAPQVALERATVTTRECH